MTTPVDLLSEEEKHIAEQYRRRRDNSSQQVLSLSQWRRGLIVCRALVLGIVAALLLWAVLIYVSPDALFISILVLVLAWGGGTMVIDGIQSQLRYVQCLRDINDEEIARMQRNWDRIPLTTPEIPDQLSGLVDASFFRYESSWPGGGSTNPGATAFTVMSGANWSAISRVSTRSIRLLMW